MALIILNKRFKNAIPICIENQFSKSLKNKVVMASGWNDLSKRVPKTLLYEKLKITDEITCKSCASTALSEILKKLDQCNIEVKCLRAQDPKYHFCINRVQTRSLNSPKVSLMF